MLNMNSPTVQNLIQSGFNPYNNSGYIPQPQTQQNVYYNPYNIQQPQYTNMVNTENYYYDPMPKVIVNENRGINSQLVQPGTGYNNQQSYYGYNQYAFNGYMNPILMRNQIESDRIRQREEAINQGKIWRTLLQGIDKSDNEFNIDEAVEHVESLYYREPYKKDIPIKEKMIIDKNNHLAELESRLAYYRENNIPIVNNLTMLTNHFCDYFNHIEEVIGDMDNCGITDYFRRVYPELKQEEMMREVERYNKNLKNRYNSNDFNKLIDQVTGDKPDSYYAKLMEGYAGNGVKLETQNGLIITADEMEVKLPERLLKNKQDVYYEQRKKFYDAIFKKEG